jgi:hypothetical protein
MLIREDYEKRIKEINIYFEILKLLEYDNPALSSTKFNPDTNISVKKTIYFDDNKVNIMRSNAFLILYNLVESTVYNAVITIFEEISAKNPPLKYFDVIDKVKKYWIYNFYSQYQYDEKTRKETIVNTFFELANQIFKNSMILATRDLKYGGSIDADKIEKTAIDLGVNIRTLKNGFNKDTHGEAFDNVKQKRNWLAHGDKSFVEVGRDYPYNRLNDFRNYVAEHLEKFVASIESYIKNQEYKQVQ